MVRRYAKIVAVLFTILLAFEARAEAPDSGHVSPAPPLPPYIVLQPEYAQCAEGLRDDVQEYSECVHALNFVRSTFFGKQMGYAIPTPFDPRFRTPMSTYSGGLALINACKDTRKQWQLIIDACTTNFFNHIRLIQGH